MKVEDREQRLPSKIEKLYIKYEDSVIESADIVLPMFSESYKKMIASCPAANIKKIELNVINNMYGDSIVEDDIVNKKLNSDYVLFIGRQHYKKGLQALIKVIKSGNFGNLKVHVIGMGKELFPEAPDSVTFHGFLRKDIAEENELYYKLIIGAKILINVTPLWGGYSSLVEGMFFYTPIIAYPFEQLTDEFGSDIGFGRYCKTCSEDSLRDVMSEVLHSSKEQYRQMCLISHEKVKMYTWDNYVKHMLQLMDEFIENR
jgi:glycosyltransferase involved in cell wall biosynthesis